jgi:hypothetical protein
MAQDDDWGDFYDGEQDTLRQQPEQQSRPFFFLFLSSPKFSAYTLLDLRLSHTGRLWMLGFGSGRVVFFRKAFSIHVVELQLYCTCLYTHHDARDLTHRSKQYDASRPAGLDLRLEYTSLSGAVDVHSRWKQRNSSTCDSIDH